MKYYLNNRDNNRSLLSNDFEEFFRPLWGVEGHAMRTDISEKDGNIVLETDLPGMDKKDIGIELNDGYLTISAKREETSDSDEKGRFIRKERRYGSCSRSFYVGTGVEEKDISASYENGILKVTFPTEAQSRKNTAKMIEIK